MRRHLNFILFLVIFSALALVVVYFSPDSDLSYTKDGFALNTFVRITIHGGSEEIVTQAFDIIRDYENIFSRALPGSELYNLNNAPGDEWTAVSYGLYNVIETSLDYCRLSNGLFDITIAPLTDLWDFTNNKEAPAESEITAALWLVDYTVIETDISSVTLSQDSLIPGGQCMIKTNGAEIDLGAAAKGYIADAVALYLANSGVQSAVIDLGGNIYALGKKTEDTDFVIGILAPFSENEIIGSVAVSNKAVVTSGVYQRYFEDGGVLYHHIINPFTGYPADTGLYSATIIAPRSLDADILSTVCMLTGLEEALPLIESIPDTEAVFITDSGDIIKSSGVFFID